MTYINTINFLGAAPERDSEAEYRLLRLARNIITTKSASTRFSTAVKASYGSSVRGIAMKGKVELSEAVKFGSGVSYAWAEVAHEISSTMTWFNGALREDYSHAFVKSLSEDEGLFQQLEDAELTHNYMKWAFEEMREISENYSYPVDALIACLDRLRSYALKCKARSEAFNEHLEELYSEPDFSLYEYIFNHLALQAKKPKLFDLDEAYFAANNAFDIFYEALEQASRHAHTLVPGTHDTKIEFFDLEYSDPMAIGLKHQNSRSQS